MDNKVAVIGTGYVGLTTGACFAHLGHEVICADIDVEQGRAAAPRRDPDLRAGPRRSWSPRASRAGRLTLRRRRRRRPPASAEFVYLCVPTPQGDDGSADLSYIEAAAREIGPACSSPRPSWSTSRPCRWARPTVRRAGPRPRPTSRSCPTPSSSARARRSTTSSTPTAWSSAADDQSAAIRVAGALPRRPGAAHGHRPGVGRDHQVRRRTRSSPRSSRSSTPSPTSARPSAPT